jgi:AraC-like DNA-binding protein
VLTLREGETLLRDLKRDPTVLVAAPHHEFHFYVPRAALDQIADDAEARRIGDLEYKPGVPVDDQVIANLGISLRAAFRLPEQTNPMFLDHVLMATATHMAVTYGGLRSGSRTRRGGLTPMQSRRATEYLRAHLGAEVDIALIAQDCGLSTSHFRRAFRETMELAPHQWVLRARVDTAKDKLLDQRLSLDDVARCCGFADQSHFTRVFSKLSGISPGRWRRERGMPEPGAPSA